MTNKHRYPKVLISEAKKLGIDETVLDKYYNRGMTAWIDHKVPGSTPEQLGLAVAEEYVAAKKIEIFTLREEELTEALVEDTGLKPPSKIARTVKHAPTVNDDNIRSWMEDVRPKYVKRYGDKAEEKLLEAAHVFIRSKEATLHDHGEPNPRTKREFWEAIKWHNTALNNNLSESAINYHAAKIKEYEQKAR